MDVATTPEATRTHSGCDPRSQMVLILAAGAILGGLLAFGAQRLKGPTGWRIPIRGRLHRLRISHIRTAGGSLFGLAGAGAVNLATSSRSHQMLTYAFWCGLALIGLFIVVWTTIMIDRRNSTAAAAIRRRYRRDDFPALVALADEMDSQVANLPEQAVLDVLDAMQKSSAFEKGLNLLTVLDATNSLRSGTRQLYEMKYLAQTYRYDDALALSENADADDWSVVARVNTLMALALDNEARELSEEYLRPELSEAQAVLRRNTVTLFPADVALKHLDDSYTYFKKVASEFRLATVDTNRSVVYLRCNQPADARMVLERALAGMRSVGSREIYQAQINWAVSAAILDRCEEALEWLDKAGGNVPLSLLLDQVKIRMNRVVVRALMGISKPSETEQDLLACVEALEGFAMPELRRTLLENIAVARRRQGAAPSEARGSLGALGLRVPRARGPWQLMMSVHWRY